jgi:hypothetical protein
MAWRRVKTKTCVDQEQKRKNRTKARILTRVERFFRVLKAVRKFRLDQHRAAPPETGEGQFTGNSAG